MTGKAIQLLRTIPVLALLILAACSSDVTRSAPGAPYHHLAGGGFRNSEGSPERKASSWDILKFVWALFTDSEDVEVPKGHSIGTEVALRSMRWEGNPSVTWLGHATFLIRIGGKTILTDPFLTKNAGPGWFAFERYVSPGIPLDKMPPIDIVVVSHNHYDHLDSETVDSLPNKDRITVIAPLGLREFFLDLGYKRVRELDWYKEAKIGAVALVALPAVHFSRRGLFDRNETLWASYSIRTSAKNIWFSGDTGHGPIFKEIGENYGPFDLAIVPIGGYEPQVVMKSLHVTPEEAVQLALDVRARRAIGMHWGTVKVTLEDPFEAPGRFKAAARAKGLGADNAWVLKIGETRGF